MNLVKGFQVVFVSDFTFNKVTHYYLPLGNKKVADRKKIQGIYEIAQS